MSLPIALQLYTVRDEMAKDFAGTLRAVAAIGYKYIEFAGLFNQTPEQAKALCDELKLVPVAAHCKVNDDPAVIADIVKAAKIIGYKYIVSGLPQHDMRTSSDGYRKAAEILSKGAAELAKAGLTFCYHNHNWEYDRHADGKIGMEILFDGTKLQSELDVYWVKRGGHDPIAWMNKLTGRTPLLHIKDMDKSPDQKFTEVGTGIIDMHAVVRNAPKIGAKYLIVEQDKFWLNDSPLQSAKLSFENLTKVVAAAK